MISEPSEHTILSLISTHFPNFEPVGKLQKLSGGYINHVWRLQGKSQSVIIKHAPPHIASNPEVPLSSDRIDYEARALQLFAPGGPLNVLAAKDVRPPELLFYEPGKSILVMEDLGGKPSLAQGIPDFMNAKEIGKKLGTFIGNLHCSTFEKESFRDTFNNHEIQKTRNKLQYQPAFTYAGLQQAEQSAKLKQRTRQLGNQLLKPGRCLIMGDLWPPSIFVGQEQEIRPIDWEFSHYGKPLQDIAHFAAHCIMQHQTASNPDDAVKWHRIWIEFCNAYRKTTGYFFDHLANEQEVKGMYVHTGAEILIRSFGPFKNGYVYEGFSEKDEFMQQTKKMAVNFILKSTAYKKFSAFFDHCIAVMIQ